MRLFVGLFLLTILPATASFAATDQECSSLWKTLDVNANGALEQSEDAKGYIAAIQKSGVQLVKPDQASRDEFLSYCKTSITNVNTESPANTKDFGKGDLTPSKSALSEEDARKKFEANGFKNVRDMQLDAQGIWHATAFADGKDKPVAIDAQGDIVGAKTVEPLGSGSSDGAASSARTSDGNSSVGLYLWVFILIGNAVALLMLSGVGGKTSAMGNSNLTYADRH
jgi:hypothetical protein